MIDCQRYRLEDAPVATRSVAIGVFDGLHLGHRAVIAAARDVAACGEQPMPLASVLSLVDVPKPGGRLLTEARQQALLDTLGVDEWIEAPFASLRDLSPQAFVREVLWKRLGARRVCCGYNFRFGKGGVGDASLLERLCRPLGIAVCTVAAVDREGVPVSSTEVRRLLAAGRPEQAAGLLGRPFEVAFPVQSGEHRGAGWGFPTINQRFPDGFAVPRFGVYASLVTIDGVQHRAVTNIGVHPTVGDAKAPQAETWIQAFSGDLYGKTVSVQLIRFLRAEQCFDTVDALKRQVEDDREHAISLLTGEAGARAVLLDFDDTLQDRPAAFLSAMEELMQRHFPGLPAERRRERAQQMLLENHDGYVDYSAYFERFFTLWHWQYAASAGELLREFRLRFPYHTRLLPGAVSVLRELKCRGYRLGVITNGIAAMQNLKLDVSGLRPLLDEVLVSGEEGVHKPDPELFYRAAGRLCVAPDRCIYVGDYPPNDIEGARAAGMRPLYLNVHGRDRHPEGVEEITSLSALPNACERLLSC